MITELSASHFCFSCFEVNVVCCLLTEPSGFKISNVNVHNVLECHEEICIKLLKPMNPNTSKHRLNVFE